MEKLNIKYKVSGIYKITNLVTNKYYIGSASCLNTRISKHKSLLIKNKHYNKHLQSSFNKYTIENFKIEILEICEKERLINREQYYIDLMHPHYNKCLIAGNTLGYKHTEEFMLTKRKPIVKLDFSGNLLGEYKSVTECAKIENLKRCSISGCISKGKGKTLYNNIYISKEEYLNRNIKDILYERIEVPKINLKKGFNKKKNIVPNNYTDKSILQLDLYNNQINEFNNIKCLPSNFLKSTISRVLSGKKKTAYRFKWILKNNITNI